jgi:hypothetical protein
MLVEICFALAFGRSPAEVRQRPDDDRAQRIEAKLDRLIMLLERAESPRWPGPYSRGECDGSERFPLCPVRMAHPYGYPHICTQHKLPFVRGHSCRRCLDYDDVIPAG